MSLFALRDHLKQVKMASLATLCANFQSEPDTLRGMLAHWIRKGVIRQVMPARVCKTCNACGQCAIEIYEWAST